MNITRHLPVSTIALAALPMMALAQPWITYDAALGSLPDAQCWEHREDIAPPMTYPFGLTGNDLHLSTLDFAATGETGGGVWWQRTDVAIDFAADFAIEARVRIISAPSHSVNPQSGWPRPGYALTIYDIHGRLFWVGLGDSEIFLSNTAFGQYGSPNTVTLAFNTTDVHHIYRIQRAAGGVGATLLIDGVPRLTLAALGPVESASPVVYFGDPTYWANSDSLTSWFRYSTDEPDDCPADLTCDDAVDSSDFFAFLAAFFAGGPAADFDHSGAVDSSDFFGYLAAFFEGC